MNFTEINIARFHPILVHLPLGILLFTALLQLCKTYLKIVGLEKAISIGLFTTIISSIFTITTGLLLADQGAYDESTLTLHKRLGIATGILSLLLYLGHTNRNFFLKKAYPYLLPITVMVVMITGHFGGTLTHGPNYLFSKPNEVSISNPNDYTIYENTTNHTVEIKNLKFTPNYIEVNIGDTITFINRDFIPHDVTEETTKKWTSSILETGNSWQLVVTESADYFCSLHVVMKGKIRIRP